MDTAQDLNQREIMDSLTDQAQQTRTGKGRFALGGPASNKKALKHGLYAYQAMLNGKGLDERTSLFKAMREKEQELITTLGGAIRHRRNKLSSPTPSRICSTSPAWIIT